MNGGQMDATTRGMTSAIHTATFLTTSQPTEISSFSSVLENRIQHVGPSLLSDTLRSVKPSLLEENNRSSIYSGMDAG